MAGDEVSPAAPEPAFRDGGPVERYLAVVQDGLVGPWRWRREVIAELRDGLAEAARSHAASAAAPGEAAAVAEFGSPRAVLDGFIAVRAASLANRVARGLLASGPVAAAVWVAAMATSGTAPWRSGAVGPWRLLPGVGVLVVVAVVASLLVMAVTGRAGYRWGVTRPRLAPAAAGVATTACAAADIVMLVAVGVWLVGAGAPAGWPMLVVAAAVSGGRCLLAGCAARRCLLTRARLA